LFWGYGSLNPPALNRSGHYLASVEEQKTSEEKSEIIASGDPLDGSLEKVGQQIIVVAQKIKIGSRYAFYSGAKVLHQTDIREMAVVLDPLVFVGEFLNHASGIIA
jgi:hypothetical protein